MATVTWESPTSFTNALTTGLDSLASGSATAASTAIDNSTNLDMFADFSAILGSINPSGTPYLELHLLPRLGDASTYADRSTSTLAGQLVVTTGSSAKSGMFVSFNGGPIIIPPGLFKVQVVNQTGVSLAASGNTVSYRAYGQTVA